MRRRWLLALGVLVGAAVLLWLLRTEPASAPGPEPAPALAAAPAPAPREPTRARPRQPDDEAAAQEMLRRWARALEPVFDGGPAEPPRKEASSPAPSPARPAHGPGWPYDRPDAGAAPTCQPGSIHLEPSVGEPSDLVVAIDTSGSMDDQLPVVNRWLRSLDDALVRAAVDVQLVVVVNPRRLKANLTEPWSPRDSGSEVQANILSNDVLEVLVSSDKSQWIKKLRPGASVHLVLVTDDNPSPGLAGQFLERVTELAGGRLGTASEPAFRIHAVLGYHPTRPDEVLVPDAPLTDPDSSMGEGLEYQRLVIRTGGLRASLWYPDGYEALTRPLVAGFSRTAQRPCTFALPEGARVTTLRTGSKLLSRTLPEGWECLHGSGSYSVSGEQLTLCPQTCAAVADAGLDLNLWCQH